MPRVLTLSKERSQGCSDMVVLTCRVCFSRVESFSSAACTLSYARSINKLLGWGRIVSLSYLSKLLCLRDLFVHLFRIVLFRLEELTVSHRESSLGEQMLEEI